MRDKKKILAVDDNPTSIDILREIFEDEYLLATATNGLEAIQVAERFRPDIILLDIVMPGIDGVITCRKLRALRKLWNNRVIVVSANAMPYERLAAMSAGADAYVIKPFNESELRGVIRRLIDLPWHQTSYVVVDPSK